jgi:hypothetical protein
MPGNASWLMRQGLPRAEPALLKLYGILIRKDIWIDNYGNSNGIEIVLVGTGTHFQGVHTTVANVSMPPKQIQDKEMGTSEYQSETKPKLRRI